MHIQSINIAQAKTMTLGQRTVKTGIDKQPTFGAVIGLEGLEHDTISDRKNHGGPDQAVYVYGSDDYDYFAERFDLDFSPGRFGENLTVAGLASPELRVGDRLSMGDVVLEVTAPRIPCGVFEKHMQQKAWLKSFIAAARPGVYCRVINTGEVSQDMPVTLSTASEATVSIIELFHYYYQGKDKLSAETIAHILASPVAERVREMYEDVQQ